MSMATSIVTFVCKPNKVGPTHAISVPIGLQITAAKTWNPSSPSAQSCHDLESIEELSVHSLTLGGIW